MADRQAEWNLARIVQSDAALHPTPDVQEVEGAQEKIGMSTTRPEA
jgi:hypothetical protein